MSGNTNTNMNNSNQFPLSVDSPISAIMADRTNGSGGLSKSKLSQVKEQQPMSGPIKSSESSASLSSTSSSFAEMVAAYQQPQNAEKDAGNKPLDHYKNKLPGWRNSMRNALLPIIRWETPYVAQLQQVVRTPILDFYFVMSANLGSHTFYLIVIPIVYWFGLVPIGRDFLFVLGFGVYFTGFVKDLLCLPRPLSPPLHRLTMSGSAALEYGFPSTHTANATSATLVWYCYLMENKAAFEAEGNMWKFYTSFGFMLLYWSSMAFGRLYCGMHGFSDLISGGLIGYLVWVFRIYTRDYMDYAILQGAYSTYFVSLFIGLCAFLIRVHPEPTDDCPCFDDGVAFVGVIMGAYLGQWHYGKDVGYTSPGCYGCAEYDHETATLWKNALRFILGSVLIGIWKPTTKKALHEALPPVFRFFERNGLSMPRRFFLPASQYEDVPSSINEDSLLSSKNLSSIFKHIRARSDSVGPQSSADMYESIAFKEYQNQKNKTDGINYRGKESLFNNGSSSNSNNNDEGGDVAQSSSLDKPSQEPMTMNSITVSGYHPDEQVVYSTELQTNVVKPRIRYDVEVITRLIVYAGISAIALDLCPRLFKFLGI